MNPERLRSLGWNAFFQQQLGSEDSADHQAARVTAHFGAHIRFLGEDGEFSVPIQLVAAAGDIAVGDWFLLENDTCRAVRRLDRQTVLERKAAGEEVRSQLVAANFDTIFIVSSCNDEFNPSRLERYLALTLQSGAVPVVVLTKSDLCENPAELRARTEQLHAGLLVETLDARDPEQVAVLHSWCRPGQTVALLGSSGVGKSTLATTLGAGALPTGEVREKDAKGRHTTTSRSLHQLPSGGLLLDNPGMRELQLPECEAGVADLFEEITELARRCRFRDCSHRGDDGCAITAAVDDGTLDPRRFESFMKLEAEQARNARSLAERRERDRRTGQMYKSIIAEKQRRQGR